MEQLFTVYESTIAQTTGNMTILNDYKSLLKAAL